MTTMSAGVRCPGTLAGKKKRKTSWRRISGEVPLKAEKRGEGLTVVPRVNQRLVITLRPLPHRPIAHRDRLPKPRVRIQHPHTNVRRAHLLPVPRDHPVAHDKQQLPRVRVRRSRDRVERRLDAALALRVARDESDAEELSADGGHADHPAVVARVDAASLRPVLDPRRGAVRVGDVDVGSFGHDGGADGFPSEVAGRGDEALGEDPFEDDGHEEAARTSSQDEIQWGRE